MIAGLDEWNIRCIKEFTGGGELPWVIARNSAQLETALRPLVTDWELRLTSGRYARTFMEKLWSEKQVLQILLRAYESI